MDKENGLEVIALFDGEYQFLSNFYESEVSYKGLKYQNSESAYQAHKFLDNHEDFTNLKPMKAKNKARKKEDNIREDWDKVKEGIMLDIVRAKFTQNEELKRLLINTGDAYLVEGNYWGDVYWGMCDGEGDNKLGKILMRVREELR